MRTATVIGAITVAIAFFLIYYSYGFYVDRSLQEACENSDARLAGFAQTYFADRVGELAGDAGVSDLAVISRVSLGPKLEELRKSGKLEGDGLRKLAEADVIYVILGDYLLDSRQCDLHRNVARLGQVGSVVLYGNAFSGRVQDLGPEVYRVAESSREVDHTRPEKDCGFSGNWVLRGEEESYCEALHTENYRIVKALEKEVRDDEDDTSKEFKAVLANCFAECVNEEKAFW